VRTLLQGDFTVETAPGGVETSEFLDPRLEDVQPVDEAAFRQAMRLLPASVVMVTTRIDGRPWGLTISSCCSLTLSPPQILVSVQLRTATCQEILRSRRFGASILASGHKAVAEHGAAPGAAKFIDHFCEPGIGENVGSPAITGALYHLDCRLADTHQVGDHMLLVGLVEAAYELEGDETRPLVYFDGQFWTLGLTV